VLKTPDLNMLIRQLTGNKKNSLFHSCYQFSRVNDFEESSAFAGVDVTVEKKRSVFYRGVIGQV
jgi:ribosomal protein S3AE